MSGGVGFGPVGPVAGQGPPFAVAGPSSVTLDGARSGSGSFAVSNLTGRPVRARVMVVPGAGADASWFQIAGESERAVPVAGTATVDVAVKVPEKAPAGSFSFAVGAALEEAPDQVVSGPTVAFDVPEPKKRKFPIWILILIVLALLLLVGGGIAIWLLTRPPADPQLETEPTITGAVGVGLVLTATDGAWDPDEVVRVKVWQACPGTATDEDDEGCENIVVGAGDEAIEAQGPTFVVSSDLEGVRIRVMETAVIVVGDDAPEDLSDLPHASAASLMTDPVPPAPPTTALVPSVEGLTYGDAQAALSQAGFQVLGTTSSEEGVCNPPIEDQNPDAGVEATLGSVVAVTTKQPPPVWECFQIELDDDILIPVLPNEWVLETVDP